MQQCLGNHRILDVYWSSEVTSDSTRMATIKQIVAQSNPPDILDEERHQFKLPDFCWVLHSYCPHTIYFKLLGLKDARQHRNLSDWFCVNRSALRS